MEFLAQKEIQERREDLRAFLAELMATKLLVGKRNAAQWRFFRACFERLIGSTADSEFDSISKIRAAQLKFEVEDKLRWFFLRPGKQLKYTPALVHKSYLSVYGLSPNDRYPELAGYCLLIRDIAGYSAPVFPIEETDLGSYLERVVAECIDAEFRAYAALPAINQEELDQRFCPHGPAMKEIITLLHRHKLRGWVINNPLNPSTKRLLRIKIHHIGYEECAVHTTEYWYLRWWDNYKQKWGYPYRETNTQVYILRKHEGTWKVYQNLRPAPRTSAPHRQSSPSRLKR
ncbi:MAG: hypothetical protein E4H01_02270 [Lysobacterales bacterium]|nr:MAG: hypothetical protein E4H01_02270 [Xanthomonadales bacterium]